MHRGGRKYLRRRVNRLIVRVVGRFLLHRLLWSRRRRVIRLRAAWSLIRGGSVIYGVRLGPGPEVTLPDGARNSFIGNVEVHHGGRS